ncbi:hypothetical protein CBI38_32470 (plasmid) [Rhodococcus oxybenzonivorans]|uniref:Uncharacterized protein n=1 Tax=Rhodococcus oxybenzonivorans TaxID=1990687 RepID=A0A2S2C5W8_9NOCA|nr:hypothetical protein CBI38_32470 [Rhodococcus oxybenzonivorans]
MAEIHQREFYQGDGVKAYELLTQTCKETFSEKEYVALSDFNQATPRELVSVTARVDGSRGFVDTVWAAPQEPDNNMPWVLEDGEWRNDDCRLRQ